jgi:hypothetical protein
MRRGGEGRGKGGLYRSWSTGAGFSCQGDLSRASKQNEKRCVATEREATVCRETADLPRTACDALHHERIQLRVFRVAERKSD